MVNYKGAIYGLIITVILAVVFFNVANTNVPLVTVAVHNLTDTLAAQTTVIGTGPASLIGNADEYFGWGIVAGLIMLVLSLGFGLFKMGRR